ncbi:MAG: redoxin domain-containing protein [bacterium]|nr:redoxin domain-containing protein [bacterium]
MKRLPPMLTVWVIAMNLVAACQPSTPAPPTLTALRATPALAPTPTDAPFFAPDFALTAVDGMTYRLSDLRGRTVIVNFWATWCAPCVDEMPALQTLADQHADSLTVLGINMRESDTLVQVFAQAHAIRFPLLLNPDDATVIAYRVVGLPQTVVVAPDGTVIDRTFGPVTVERLTALIDSGQRP